MIHEKVEDDEEDEAIATALVEQYAQHMEHDSFSHHSGSMLNHHVINRNRAESHEWLYLDYFINISTTIILQKISYTLIIISMNSSSN